VTLQKHYVNAASHSFSCFMNNKVTSSAGRTRQLSSVEHWTKLFDIIIIIITMMPIFKKKTGTLVISEPDPVYKVRYLNNVLTAIVKGDGCALKHMHHR